MFFFYLLPRIGSKVCVHACVRVRVCVCVCGVYMLAITVTTAIQFVTLNELH